MAFSDLRGFIARMEEAGELQRIDKEVDWDLEVGAITRRSYDLKAPAPFFWKIKGYPEGYRVLGAPLGTSKKPNRYLARLALSFGLKADTPTIEIMEEYIKRKKHPLKPVQVSTGPCKENIHLGEEADLEAFPAPMLHWGDGGRYIGTWHLVATKDAETGWVNWGMYRMMIHDKRSTGIRINQHKDIGRHYYPQYEAKGRPMEFAAALGTEPVSPIIAATRVPPGVDEVDIVGGIRGEPVELVKCETVDLFVPATAEIVLEGEIWPHERKEEGPFGEYTGYRAGERAPRPVCRIKAITHRNNPILPISCLGVPADDNDVMGILESAEVLDELRSQGFPVRMVYKNPDVSLLLTMVSTKVPFPNYAKHLAAAVWGSNAGQNSYYLLIVDDDVDVTNFNEVVWALTTRCHPDRGILKMTNTLGGGQVSFLNSYEKRHNIGAHVLLDCTWPKEWPKEAIPVKASFDVLWPKDIQQKVLENWGAYGYNKAR